MSDYKGIYYNDKKDPRYFEGGAHFRYRDLFSVLQSLVTTQTAALTHKRTFTFSPNQQTLPKPKTRNVIFYDTKHMHNTNKTNSFLLQKKLLNSNNKKNTSLEKQPHHYNNVIMNHSNNNHSTHINAVSRNSDYAALHKRKNNIDSGNVNCNSSNNNNCNNNIALKKHSLNNSNSSNMILFPKSQYKSNCIECMNNSNSGILVMKGHTSRNVNNNCHTKSLDMNGKEFNMNMNDIRHRHNEYESNSNTNDDYEMSKCDYNMFSIKNMKMKLLKKNATSTSGLNGIHSYHKNKENVLLQRNTNNNHNSVLNNNNSSYQKDNVYNNTVIQRRNSYKNVLPRNIKTNTDVLFTFQISSK